MGSLYRILEKGWACLSQVISCSSELTSGFLVLILLQVFSKRKVSLLWKGAEGEDCSARTTEEFAAAASEKEDAATAGPSGWPEQHQAAVPFQLFYVVREKQQLREAEVLMSWQAAGHWG